MSEKSKIRTWNGQAATSVDAHDAKVVVTIGKDRKELTEVEWDALPSHEDEVPEHFNKTRPEGERT